ncbi:DUF262 domain-containing protein [Pseudomonas sp. Leaf129]|uniref:DUF262 domain-containing protein n=1 Tax=Pseudomonas sp. Leaf129 TaxID=1736268 RepID=UPI000AC208C0|nr:DUF262 domain-containing protein [Pseudomonas sp. Leaf129]
MDIESDFEREEELSSPNILEEKYRKQMRQIHPQKIELPISTLQAMIKEQITLNPDFQRRGRWDTKRRSRFIESLIMNVPVPPVFLGEDEYGTYVVLDGRQRLTALSEFLDNHYALEDLTVWSELNKKRYSDLVSEGLNRALTRRFIPAILLLKESSAEVKYDVFDRLNTGGVKANEMEIRNAVFRGDFTKLMHEMSSLQRFRQLWAIPEGRSDLEKNTLYSTMEDVEYVLRFYALQEPERIEGRLKDYLGLFMKSSNEAYRADESKMAEDRALFLRTLESTWKLLGSNAFLRPSTNDRFHRSAPLADAVLYGMSFIDPNAIGEGDDVLARSALDQLLLEPEFAAAVRAGTNGKGAIAKRTSSARAAFAAVLPHAVRA